MTTQFQKSLFPELEETTNINDWTFNGASTRELTHCYHDYPARMIPQVAAKLFYMYGNAAELIFDPYCGTGTSLVEGLIKGIDGIGTDLNPLACLIAHTKTSTIEPDKVYRYILEFNKFMYDSTTYTLPKKIEGITDLYFWFKPNVVEKLNNINVFIKGIDDESINLFFKVAFSETIRDSSNTRNNEFKLFRYKPEKLIDFNPDVFGIMTSKLMRNLKGLKSFAKIVDKLETKPKVKIYNFNTVNGIPEEYIKPLNVDIVVTSPPYGDSHTTVAYGQYSRLSAAWLGLPEPGKVDGKLMGGKSSKRTAKYPCPSLNEAIKEIIARDIKRAYEVVAFYNDLFSSICNVSKVIKPDGYACYVVANRTVKGITLPTDKSIRCFFEKCGFKHIDTFERFIPNKRMPLRNSPTNEPGVVASTMRKEYIVVMKKLQD